MPAIFISYRRDDSAFESTVLYEVLQKSFGKRNVFMDVDGIPIGVDFGSHIVKTLRRSEVCLAIISSSWLDATTPSGQRRLDDPQDFVRQELEVSQASGLHIVPVLIGKSELPPAAELPASLQFLPSLQAIRVRPGGDLQKDLATLCHRIREIAQLRAQSQAEAAHADGAQVHLWPRLVGGIRKCWWHPLLDGLMLLVFFTYVMWMINPRYEWDAEYWPLEILTFAMVWLAFYILAVLLAAATIALCAVQEVLFIGAVSLLRNVRPWPHWPLVLASGGMGLGIVGIFLTQGFAWGFPVNYWTLWMIALFVQHWLDRRRFRGRSITKSKRQSIADKALTAAAGLAGVGLFALAALLGEGFSDLAARGNGDFNRDLIPLAMAVAFQASSYCTAAQIVRGTLRFNSQGFSTRDSPPSTVSPGHPA